MSAEPHLAVFSLDSRSLSLFRIAIGSVCLWDWIARFSLRTELYGAHGLLPERFASDTFLFQAFALGGDAVTTGLFLLGIGLSLALVLGVGSRVACLGLWLLVGSLGAANPAVESYGDRMLMVVLFFAAFLPLDAHAALRPARSTRAGSVCNVASAALVLQIVLLYLSTGLLKTGPAWHAEADAIGWVLEHEYWARPTSRLLLEVPALLPWMTRAVYAFEVAAPLLLLCPWQQPRIRLGVVALLWAFHLGLASFMVLGPFPFVCIASTSALLPAVLWDRLGLAKPEVTEAPTEPAQGSWARLARWVPALALVGIVLQNAAVLLGVPRLGEPVDAALRSLGLRQHWSMYAPEPRREDGWFVFVGELADGSRIDLHRENAPVSLLPPERPWSHPDFRLAMLIGHAHRYGDLRRNLAQWLCESDAHPAHVEVRYVEEHPGERPGRGRFEEHRLGRLSCAEALRTPPR